MLLVAWYGLLQAGYFLLNAADVPDPGEPPFDPPPAGWQPQTMAFADRVNSEPSLLATRDAMMLAPPRPKDGVLQLPRCPGIACSLDREVMARFGTKL